MGYAISTIYGEGQKFSKSVDQGSTYLGVSYAQPLMFNPNFDVTTPIRASLYRPTVSNYPQVDKSFFMGSFDGFWVHKVFNDGHLVMTVQGVNQQMFIPVQHDRVESVSMSFGAETIPYDGPVRPPVPSPGVSAMLGLAALFAWGRKRFK
jgi:hypothetical protein